MMNERDLIVRLTKELYDLKATHERIYNISEKIYTGCKEDIKVTSKNKHVLYAIIDLCNELGEVEVYED